MNKRLYLVLPFFIIILGANAQFAPDKKYSLETKSTGRFLNVKAGQNAIFGYKRSGSEWYIISNGDNTFRLENVATTEVLSVANESTSENEPILTEIWVNSDHQKWIISKNEFYFVLTNVKSGLVLSAVDELPGEIDPNPDVAYYNSYVSEGFGVQKTYASLETQKFHIAPIKDNYEEALVVPQLGWRPNHNKEALLITNTEQGTPSFNVIDLASNASVLSGTMTKWTHTATWNQFYYKADLSSLTSSGKYQINANGFTANITINDNIYSEIQCNKGGTLNYHDLFEGFWKYNSFYPQTHTIPKASLELINGNEVFTFDGTYDVQPYGWFDAHSRDSKIGRTAKAISEFCLARLHTHDVSNQYALETQIKYGLEHLFLTQNADGSWPAGRIRQPEAPRTYYYWVTNVDVNTTARIARTMALAHQVFQYSDTALATKALATAEKAWEFVINNETLIDPNLNGSFKGQSIDILAAAVEMAYATGEAQYFDKADEMFTDGNFINGRFRKESGAFPSENTNIYAELDNGSIPFLSRYYGIARTEAMKNRVETVINNFVDFWAGKEMGPFGFPQHPLDRTTDFGNTIQVARLGFNMLGVADYLDNEYAYNVALSCFYMLTGYNPYETSYIVGIGDTSITPSANYFKRSFDDGTGAILPGFTNDGTSFIQNFDKYQTTEGVVPVSSFLFYMLSRLDHLPSPESAPDEPETGDLVINEVNSHEAPKASYVEIFNPTKKKLNLSKIQVDYYSDGSITPTASLVLTGIIEPYCYKIITRDSIVFDSVYGFASDFKEINFMLNSGTDGIILRHETAGIIDQFNDAPLPTGTYNEGHLYIRNSFDNDGTDLVNHWSDVGKWNQGTPGRNNSNSKVISRAVSCQSYTWDLNGETYYESGIYQTTLQDQSGNDSIATLFLTVNNIVTSVEISGTSLSANQPGASYKWLDCENDYAAITGAASKTFSPLTTGNYAVEVTTNLCIDTSACYPIYVSAVNATKRENSILIYPNPTREYFNIHKIDTHEEIKVSVRSIEGELISSQTFYNEVNVSIGHELNKGIYLVEITNGEHKTTKKIIKY